MTDEGQRQRWVLRLHDGNDGFEVVEELVETIYVTARPFRAAVPPVIVRMHRAAPLGEPARQLLVAPTVLGVAVNEDQGPVRVFGKPRPPQQAQAILASDS